MDHTVALRSDGTLWGWGLDPAGWTSSTSGTRVNTPQRIATNGTWSAVDAGSDHTMALQTNGTLWGWGNSGGGRLGNGTFINTNSPQPVSSNMTWRTVSTGGGHTVAILADGSLWSWGNNYVGQLGDDTYTGSLTPKQIGTNDNWQAVSAGAEYTVALRADGSLAIRSDGTLWAWGDNFWGQLGDGHMFTKTNTPQQIGANTNWQTIAAGGTHSVALQADGSLWTWGFNEDGQLGNGTDGPFTNLTTPQRIGTATNWVAVTAGRNHTVALKSDGSLWAWGDNGWGQLGIGTFDDANTPQPVLGGAVWGPSPQ
jgi:alpha-tubulin suppressor-like RCC1 family protein